MAVKITGIEKGSIANEADIHANDVLISINEKEIDDILDYEFYAQNEFLTLLLSREQEEYIVEVEKDEFEDLGLNFNSYLMDKQRTCKNKCVFCFVDQMPKDMRKTLYFKDDDARLSFLFGNYITLTNITEKEVARIINMHISPINISVHTMNPKLRLDMMKNPNAGKALELIERFAKAGIAMNTQLVLCPGINDGKELEYSLAQLAQYNAVQSIASVPVGLTKFRDNLFKLNGFTKEEAQDVIHIIDAFGNERVKQGKPRLAFAADEFYLLAGQTIPEASFYEDFAQLENGVGLWALLKSEFEAALEEKESKSIHRSISIATGKAAYPLMQLLAKKAMQKFAPLEIKVYEISNDFFGHSITVAGLLTGQDVKKQLENKLLGETLLLPAVMCQHKSNVFLDDMSVDELSLALDIPIQMIENNGESLLDAMIGGAQDE